jgi:hypothetical protein
MKYRADLTEQDQTAQNNPNDAEEYVERMLLEFELLREIWESEKYKRKRRH